MFFACFDLVFLQNTLSTKVCTLCGTGWASAAASASASVASASQDGAVAAGAGKHPLHFFYFFRQLCKVTYYFESPIIRENICCFFFDAKRFLSY